MTIRFVLVLLMIGSGLYAQTAGVFPDDFFGSYKGQLTIKNAQSEQTIGMEFHMRPTDSVGSYEYQIVYIADGNRQERNYSLVETNKEKGEYVVDENNGILLDARYIGNKLISVFEVQNSLLTTTETFFKDHMIFEIVFSKTDSPSVSGNTDIATPEVRSYPVSVYQYARLNKVTD